MKIYAIRHTCVAVEKGVCYGQLDVDVQASFKAEATKVQARLKGINFDKIYSSPLRRCAKLAELIAVNQSEIKWDDRLMELNFGAWEGVRWSLFEQSEYAETWFDDYVNVPTLNGESYASLVKRLRKCLHEIVSGKGDAIAMVCHAGTIRAMHHILNQTGIDQCFNIKIGYGDVHVFDLKKTAHF